MRYPKSRQIPGIGWYSGVLQALWSITIHEVDCVHSITKSRSQHLDVASITQQGLIIFTGNQCQIILEISSWQRLFSLYYKLCNCYTRFLIIIRSFPIPEKQKQEGKGW
jgi:hypothetical protein